MAQKQGKGKLQWTPNRKASNASADAGRKKRRQARIDTQKTQEAMNRELRRSGQPTPWETACALRAKKRVGLRPKVKPKEDA